MDAMVRVLAVMDRIGLPTEERHVEDTFYYDGRSVALSIRPGVRLTPRCLLHEASHWLVALPEERMMPEYGMVARPVPAVCAEYVRRADAKVVLDRPARNVREAAAQMVNWQLGVRLGVGPVFGDWEWEYAVGLLDKLPWREMAQEWLGQVGIDPAALADRLVN